ncbi:MAG: acyl-CoA dehydrogenase family protein [Hyphomicrobiaceae bacterium]
MNDAAIDTHMGADWVAPDCAGMNFYECDPGLNLGLALYLPDDLRAVVEPHMRELGRLGGTRLDELARIADRHPPVLHPRDAFGRDIERIEYHPAFAEMERMAYGKFSIHRMSHVGGVFGWPEPMPPLVKYIFQYLFVQGEFGLMCPVSMTDTGITLLSNTTSRDVAEKYLPRMLSDDVEALYRCAQFLTEQGAGSDVGNIEVRAKPDGDQWRIFGDKWFCSSTDAEVILLLARTDGAPSGSRGLSLFLVPRELDDGSKNNYRIVRLKNKLGTNSMASGEVSLNGAVGYLIGDQGSGLRQIMKTVSLSRLSHGVRAAAMMRRCLNEALQVARHRRQFGARIIEFPLLRRQLMKIMLPTEQALSVLLFAGHAMAAANAGDDEAEKLVRILTPLLKLRACRDNVPVATGAMEIRGGNGYIEDWVNARLIRDAQVGLLWEGTSNINALDVIARAIPKVRAHEALAAGLHAKLDETTGLPGQFKGQLVSQLDRAMSFAEGIASDPRHEDKARLAVNALYNVTSAVLLAWEGASAGQNGGDARRLLLARMVLDHRLLPQDPMATGENKFDKAAAGLLLDDAPARLPDVIKALTL